MNRLILVGNGFDLAHGLKTSYCDFIRWYLYNSLNNFHINNVHDDLLLTVGHQNNYSRYDPNLLPLSPANTIQNLRRLQASSQRWNVNIKSNLLKITIEKADKLNWVDIELEYFEELTQCVDRHGLFDSEKVNKLNTQFDFFKTKLAEYLSLEQLNIKNFAPDGQILRSIKTTIEWKDVDTGLESNERFDLKTRGLDPHSKNTLILNFNYTNTIEKYVEELRKDTNHKNTKVNYIHGKLQEPNNPIIFGFGDEFNKKYNEFEEQKNNDVFEHVKSYWYFRSSNYRELVRYLNSGMFQIFVMGHSCGLSDRTMFREIFEHENCKSVKIFYYERADGTNDFHEKTVELGRHFTDKGKMRKKIVEFDENCKFPQPNHLE